MPSLKGQKESELNNLKSGGSFIKRLSQIFPWSKSSTLISHDRKIVSSKERTVLDSLGFYQNDNEIGRGSTSIVLSGYSKKSGKEVAIKIYDKARVLKKGKSSHYDKFIKRELRITAQVSHPYIVKCVAGASTPNRVYIIMEKLSGRTVRDEVNRHFRLPEPVVGIWITQLAKAIDYLHNEGIAHRDIKCSNLLLDKNDTLKLSDFGVATDNLNDPRALGIIWSTTFVGNLQYAAPEILLQREYVATKADMWSIGVVLYVCLRGHFPFPGTTPKQVYFNIKRGLPKSERIMVSEPCERLIQNLLRRNISDRFDSQRLIEDNFCKRFDNLEIDDVKGLDSNVDNSFCDEIIKDIDNFDVHTRTREKFICSSVDKPMEKSNEKAEVIEENLVEKKIELSKTDSHTDSRASYVFCSMSEMTVPSQTLDSNDKSILNSVKEQQDIENLRQDASRLTPNTMDDSQRLATDECKELYENDSSSEVNTNSGNSTSLDVKIDKNHKEEKHDKSNLEIIESSNDEEKLKMTVKTKIEDRQAETKNEAEISKDNQQNLEDLHINFDNRENTEQFEEKLKHNELNSLGSINNKDSTETSKDSITKDNQTLINSQLVSYTNSKNNSQQEDITDVFKYEKDKSNKITTEVEEKSDKTDLKDEFSEKFYYNQVNKE